MNSEPARQPPRLDDGSAATTRRLAPLAARLCFADEIAIDFPSVDAAVDRMRHAFLAPEEPLRALSAEISVSALDALTGTSVALDLPVCGTCRTCGGRGGTWIELCHACAGSGEAIVTCPVHVHVPPQTGDGVWIRLQVSSPHALPTRVDVRVMIV